MNNYSIITGGASGLGSAISEVFAKQNKNLIILYNNSLDNAINLKTKFEKEYNIKVEILKCDISNDEDVNNVVNFIKNNNIVIDTLVNNSAVCLDSLYEEKNKINFMRTFEVNCYGTFNISRAIGDLMYKNKNGSIINLSSTNGIDKYYPMSLDYDASKAAINSITHSLATQYAPFIKVNAIAPSWVKTPNEMKDLDEEYIKSEEEKIYLNRFAGPDEIANFIYYLSFENTYINNQIIKINGGSYGD